MIKGSLKKAVSGSLVGIVSRVLEAVVRFFTLPILITYFGKETYGLIELAISVNAYIHILDLGMNMGTVKYFSQWLAKSQIKKVIHVSQSNVVFYGIVGLVNGIILLVISAYSETVFNLDNIQVSEFQMILVILALTSIINWTMYTVNQLLIAYENIAWVHLMSLVRSLTAIVSAWLTVYYQWDLITYFWIFSISNLLYIPLSIVKLHTRNRWISAITYLIPKWHGSAFREVFKYGLAIFALGIFQFSATSLRPILLGVFSPAKDVLADYRILQNFVTLVLTFGNIFILSLLPVSSRVIQDKNSVLKHRIIVDGTRKVSFLISLVLVGIACMSKEILALYVGEQNVFLHELLIFSCLIVLLQIHLSPVASMFYAVGQTRQLIYYTIPSVILSLSFLIIFADYGVAASVGSYGIYISLQLMFYYFYYIPVVLGISSLQVFIKGLFPGLFAAIATFVLYSTLSVKIIEHTIDFDFFVYSTVLILLTYLVIYSFFLSKNELASIRNFFITARKNQ